MATKPQVTEMTVEERLRASLKQVTTNAGASMLPQEIAPPPPKEALPDLKDLITDVKDRLNMIRLLETDVEWAAKEKEAKAARKPLVTRMKEILGRYRVGKCGWNEYTVNYYGSERQSIKKEALVHALVSVGLQPNVIQSVIQAATVTTTAYTLRITQPGEKEEKGEAE